MHKGIRGALVAVLAASTLALGGCVPTSPTANGWGLLWGDQKSNGTGTNPATVVFGDSLIYSSGPNDTNGVQAYADTLRFFTGHSAVVSAVAGASYSHYISDALLAGKGVTKIQDMVAFVRPHVTVIALGTNDGRLLGMDAGNPNGYTQADFQGSANTAITSALNVNSCVVLVNATTSHYPAAQPNYPAQTAGVNAYLKSRADSGGGRIRLADWDGYSGPHSDWFYAGDYHHNATGKDQYRSYITQQVGAAYNAGC